MNVVMEKIPQPPPLTAVNFPARLRAWREGLNPQWTQGKLAQILGISDRQVRRWESGEHPPTGIAAQRYELFRSGRLLEALHRDAIDLEERIRAVRSVEIQESHSG